MRTPRPLAALYSLFILASLPVGAQVRIEPVPAATASVGGASGGSLGSLGGATGSPAALAAAAVPRYQEALRALGVPDEALAKLAAFVTPEAGLTAGVVSAMADNSKETASRRALLITGGIPPRDLE